MKRTTDAAALRSPSLPQLRLLSPEHLGLTPTLASLIGLSATTGLSATWATPIRLPEGLLSNDLLDALMHIRENLSPAGRVEVVRQLQRLAIHCWIPNRPSEHFEPLIEDFAMSLEGYSQSVLCAAVAEYRQSSRWFPAVADLSAICRRMTAELGAVRYRLERLNWRLAERGSGPARQKGWADLTDEERVQHHAMMQEAFRDLKG